MTAQGFAVVLRIRGFVIEWLAADSEWTSARQQALEFADIGAAETAALLHGGVAVPHGWVDGVVEITAAHAPHVSGAECFARLEAQHLA